MYRYKVLFLVLAITGAITTSVIASGRGVFAETKSSASAEKKPTHNHNHSHASVPKKELSEEERKKQEEILKKVEKITAEELVKKQKNEIIIGSEGAPITVIEYASFSCGHCATFAEEIYPTLKKEYIDKGKATLYYRDFPLNEPALKASMLVHCADEERREAFIKTLFKTQEKWAFEKGFEEKLKNIAKIGGMDEKTFASCMENKTLEEEVMVERLAGAKALEVTSTPTIFINGEKATITDAESLRKKLDALHTGDAAKN